MPLAIGLNRGREREKGSPISGELIEEEEGDEDRAENRNPRLVDSLALVSRES